MVKKNVHDNVIYVSQGYETDKQYGRVICLDEMHFITDNPWGDSGDDVAVTFKNRHSPEFNKATLSRISSREFIIKSESPIQGIAPGQYAVIYDRDNHICYGSGVITGHKSNISRRHE